MIIIINFESSHIRLQMHRITILMILILIIMITTIANNNIIDNDNSYNKWMKLYEK